MEIDISVRPPKLTRPVKVDRQPSKLVPNIPVEPNQNGPFHLMYQPKFPEFWVEWKEPQDLTETNATYFLKSLIALGDTETAENSKFQSLMTS